MFSFNPSTLCHHGLKFEDFSPRRWNHDFGNGVHSIYVCVGSTGSAQKNPKDCIVANSFLEFISIVIHSWPSVESEGRQMVDRGESRSESNVYVDAGLVPMKDFKVCSGSFSSIFLPAFSLLP